MKTINANTKKGEKLKWQYALSNKHNLSECYKKTSAAKYNAENECRCQMILEDGWGFKILSYNKFSFTCGWETKNGLRIETPTNSYIVQPF